MKAPIFAVPAALYLAAIVSAQQVPEITTPLEPEPSTSSIAQLSDKIGPRPLTIDDKFRLYLHETFGPAALAKTVLLGAIAPTHGGSGNWGVGADAHRDRIESAIAEHVMRHTIEFAGDAALHIDPRYRKSDSTQFASRLRHALASSVIAYTDSGERTIALPRIGSAYGGAFVSNLWYPQGHNSWQDAAIRGTAYLGWTACKDAAKEFWPDVERRLRRSRLSSDRLLDDARVVPHQQ